MGSPRCNACTWLVWIGLLGTAQGVQAEDSASSIETRELNLDALVADGRAEVAMCEPSAATFAPWNPALVLVGDNEVKEQLYAFSMTADGLQFVEALDIPKENGGRPRDIEALAASGEAVMIVGSHSRNSHCEEKPRRRRMEWVRLGGDGALEAGAGDFIDGRPALDKAMASKESCLETLFVAPAPAKAAAVCGAMVDAETMADDASPSACAGLNIEGAVGLADGRIWLGLRAPLVDQKAVMLRLTPGHDELRFDHAVLVDLGGRGIRELTFDQGRQRVWGIAGPDVDRADPFRLWHVAADDLASEDDLTGAIDARELPTSSEGMLVWEGRALILIDGAATDEGQTCAVHPEQYQLALTP